MSEKAPYHHGNLRAALLEAAFSILVEVGVEGLSLRGVARRAGVSPAAPYKHFKDKQAVLRKLAHSRRAQAARTFAAATANERSPQTKTLLKTYTLNTEGTIVNNAILSNNVDPETGASVKIDLGSERVINGDGSLLEGRTLYVVQNQDNRIAVVKLSDDLSSGTLSGALTNLNFDVPTTVAGFNDALYTVNGRFNTELTLATEYASVRVEW